MSYALINRLTARPGQRDRVAQILIESGKLFEENAACIFSVVSESAEDANVLWVTDLWTSREEHEAALKQPKLRPFIEEAVPLLEGMPEQIEIRPIGGKGLPQSR